MAPEGERYTDSYQPENPNTVKNTWSWGVPPNQCFFPIQETYENASAIVSKTSAAIQFQVRSALKVCSVLLVDLFQARIFRVSHVQCSVPAQTGGLVISLKYAKYPARLVPAELSILDNSMLERMDDLSVSR